MNLISFIFTVSVFYDMAYGQMRSYIPSSKPMNWTNAQSYCRQTYTDLAAITSDEENQRAESSILLSWIGLTKSNSWTWSDGEDPKYFKWGYGEPSAHTEIGNCASIGLLGWYTLPCSLELPFLCQWRIILVTESMAWVDAMNYCKTHYKGLAFLTDKTKTLLAKIGALQARSVSVWFGLCFMNRNWLWANGEPLTSLPSCPDPGYRCGALNTKTGILENRNCNEKLNFVCF